VAISISLIHDQSAQHRAAPPQVRSLRTKRALERRNALDARLAKADRDLVHRWALLHVPARLPGDATRSAQGGALADTCAMRRGGQSTGGCLPAPRATTRTSGPAEPWVRSTGCSAPDGTSVAPAARRPAVAPPGIASYDLHWLGHDRLHLTSDAAFRPEASRLRLRHQACPGGRGRRSAAPPGEACRSFAEARAHTGGRVVTPPNRQSKKNAPDWHEEIHDRQRKAHSARRIRVEHGIAHLRS